MARQQGLRWVHASITHSTLKAVESSQICLSIDFESTNLDLVHRLDNDCSQLVARMGVFQDHPDFGHETSWDGENDTTSYEKTITAVSATFAVK